MVFSKTVLMWRRTHLVSVGRTVLGLFAIASLSSGVLAADNYTTWTYNKQFFINTSNDGAAVAGTVTAFPLVIRLNPSDFTAAQFAQCKTTGTDIRFAGKNGKHLFYQIERFNPTIDSAEIWVNVDTILGNNSSQYITMYWGNASAGDSSKPQKVFDTANGYEAVNHLSLTTGTYPDATYRRYDGAAYVTTDAAGIIGRGMSNMVQYCGVSLDNLTHTFSRVRDSIFISVWMKTAVPSDSLHSGTPIRHEGHVTAMQMGSHGAQCVTWHGATGANLTFKTWMSESSWNSYIADDNWHYFVFTYDSAAGVNCYLDGATFVQDPDEHGYLTATSTNPFLLGGNGVNDGLPGVYDELVLARKIRSADWIALCNANQQTDQTLVTTGVINVNNSSRAFAGASAIKVKSVGNNLALDFSLAQSGNIVLKMFDLRGKEVRTIAHGNFVGGNHHAEVSQIGLSRGIYLFQLQSAQGTIVRSVRIF